MICDWSERLEWERNLKSQDFCSRTLATFRGDAYQQGYAAAAQYRNSCNTYDNGYQAGEMAQSNADSQAAYAQAYNNACQAGIAQANRGKLKAKGLPLWLAR